MAVPNLPFACVEEENYGLFTIALTENRKGSLGVAWQRYE
jgi:hypothetical protein